MGNLGPSVFGLIKMLFLVQTNSNINTALFHQSSKPNVQQIHHDVEIIQNGTNQSVELLMYM